MRGPGGGKGGGGRGGRAKHSFLLVYKLVKAAHYMSSSALRQGVFKAVPLAATAACIPAASISSS